MNLKMFLNQIQESDKKFNVMGEETTYNIICDIMNPNYPKKDFDSLYNGESNDFDSISCHITMNKNIITCMTFYHHVFKATFSDEITYVDFDKYLESAVKVEVEI